jgi:uncharacterized membrane-anchored protein YjiN (DUF445 family)
MELELDTQELADLAKWADTNLMGLREVAYGEVYDYAPFNPYYGTLEEEVRDQANQQAIDAQISDLPGWITEGQVMIGSPAWYAYVELARWIEEDSPVLDDELYNRLIWDECKRVAEEQLSFLEELASDPDRQKRRCFEDSNRIIEALEGMSREDQLLVLARAAEMTGEIYETDYDSQEFQTALAEIKVCAA